MPAYFASDVHLRLDRPERGIRLARFADGLEPDDALTIVGDLGDFWLGARQVATAARDCPGLRALARFRARGGALTVLTGNHDAWLGPFYREALGATLSDEPRTVEVAGLRLRLFHGHMVGARPFWKGWMESRTFLGAFRGLPAPAAWSLDRLLDRTNARGRAADDLRHLAAFREFVRRQPPGSADILVLGHLHRPVDDPATPDRPRMVVLGGWQDQSSYLKVDASGASLIVERDPASIPCESTGRP